MVSRASLTAAQDLGLLISASLPWVWGSELPLYVGSYGSPALLHSFFLRFLCLTFSTPLYMLVPGDPFNNSFPSLQLRPWQHDPRWVLHLCTAVAQDQSRVTSEPTPYLTQPLSPLQLLGRALLESSMKGNTRQWQRSFHCFSPHGEPS